ncbi:MAG: hypothetical protein V4591_09335 [Bdellovibrionota bacterium]
MTAKLCQQLLNNLYIYSLKQEFQQERQMARELFFISTGKVNDEDPFFEQRMACFQEFFVFDYRLSDGFSGSTVFETFLYNGQSGFSVDDMNLYEQLRSFKHSLFRVESLQTDEHLIVTDLLSNERLHIFSLPEFNFAGFDSSQFFEGRLICFNQKHFFTGAFILHGKEVRSAVKKSIFEFLSGKNYCKADSTVAWKEELEARKSLLRTITEKKQQIEQTEKKKAIDLLKVTKQIAQIPRILSSNNLVMALGEEKDISCYVPESPFYDALILIHKLAYRELKCYRYKHIDPVKIYESVDDHLDNIQMPRVPARAS